LELQKTRTTSGKFTPEWSRSVSEAAIEKYKSSPKLCLRCKEPLSYEKRKNKYCSHSCAASTSNSERPKKEDRRFTCIVCGADGVDYKFGDTRKFCSYECNNKYKADKTYFEWMSGISAPVTTLALRSLLVRRDGYACAECGVSDWNGKQLTLEVEHKDGNWRDNGPGNICLLCPNCHSQTPTFRAKNAGNGRPRGRILN